MNALINFDFYLFLKLNDLHSTWNDLFFWIYTNHFTWIPLYFIIIYWIIKFYNKKAYLIIAGLLLSVAVSDQTCNYLKNSVQRLRPSHDERLTEKINLVQKFDGTYYYGGKYGFPSAHASNGTVFLIFTFLFATKNRKWLIPTISIWWILLIYSRIYVGVHFPLDILFGALTGTTICGLILFPIKFYLNSHTP